MPEDVRALGSRASELSILDRRHFSSESHPRHTGRKCNETRVASIRTSSLQVASDERLREFVRENSNGISEKTFRFYENGWTFARFAFVYSAVVLLAAELPRLVGREVECLCGKSGLRKRRLRSVLCERTRRSNHPRYWRSLLTVPIFALFISSTLAVQPDTFVVSSVDDNHLPGQRGKDFFLGPCLVNTNQTCPDEEVTFFLYTVHNPTVGQQILVDNVTSNLPETNFVASKPTKIIIHGYNSDMLLGTLVDIRDEYLKRSEYNVIHVDWHRLAIAPCYPIAVHNVPHVGDCLAQLIDRLREYGSTDIHVIGFSLGAHVPAFAANVLRPYKLSRITGLDPAMPLFVTVDKDEKLDAGDAEFVDVFHTNAFIQGKVEASGQIDFYMNGGVNQPGCWEKRNPFGCNHHRSAEYFAESINSEVGFWGWPCSGFVAYLLGLCPPRFPAVLAGDKVDRRYSGFHLVKTRAESPYAEGLFAVNLQDMHQ